MAVTSTKKTLQLYTPPPPIYRDIVVCPQAQYDRYCDYPWSALVEAAVRGEGGLQIFRHTDLFRALPETAYLRELSGDRTGLFSQGW